MRQILIVMFVTLFTLAEAVVPRSTAVRASPSYGSVSTKGKCHYVTKKVHGKKKRTKACPAAGKPAPTAPPSMFSHPTGVAVDGQGNIYVANFDGGAVVKLSPAGQLIATVTRAIEPGGLSVDTAGDLFVANAGAGEVDKFSPDGRLLARWGSDGRGPGQFDDPYSVAVDTSGVVYVADWDNSRIQKFSPSGAFLSEIKGSGAYGPDTIDNPLGIAVDGPGNVYATDALVNAIHKITPGGVVTSWGLPNTTPQFQGPTGIAADAVGNLYVVDSGNNRIDKLSSDGKLLASWGGPGSGPGQLDLPASASQSYGMDASGMFEGIAVDTQDNIYIADTNNNRVQKLSPGGQVLAVWK